MAYSRTRVRLPPPPPLTRSRSFVRSAPRLGFEPHACGTPLSARLPPPPPLTRSRSFVRSAPRLGFDRQRRVRLLDCRIRRVDCRIRRGVDELVGCGAVISKSRFDA